ncbi:DoxX family protein [Allorhizocola rhizosphaerae]|uniref:DoxX family protein n=1 Tax=Allorhizocola rhizosphaerae TaxID=1872709 RepID=UPI000E3C4218|nr:DoxX family protein [Allorhizocola rhizosphaerae]
MTPVHSSARLILSGVFMASGARALALPGHTTPQASRPIYRLDQDQADPRWPLEAHTLVRLRGAIQLSAGILLASGYLRRPAAVVLAASLIPARVAGQAFRNRDEPGERRRERMDFLKDLGLLGGLLFLAVADTDGRPRLGSPAGQPLPGRRRVHEAHHRTRSGHRRPSAGRTAARTPARTPVI